MSFFEEKNIDSFLILPREEQESIVARLEPSEALSVSLMLPWEKRLNFLELSPKFEEIVNVYPIQELYWTIKATGPRDAISVLKAMSASALQLVFDLEWWEKDTFKPSKALTWMVLLFEAGEAKVIEWINYIYERDEAILPLLLRSFIEVLKRPDDMEIQEARDVLAPFTLDDCYYIRFKNIDLQPIWGRFLAILFSESPGKYRDTLEAILWETRLEQMETAFKWRRSRLSDFGIPDYYEAIDIFAFAPGMKVQKVDVDYLDAGAIGTDLPMSFIPTIYMDGANSLLKAIEALKGSVYMERIVHEWIGVANKILIAQGTPLDEPERLKEALLEGTSLINLGLECLCSEEGIGLEDGLKTSVLEDLVRLGLTRVKEVAQPIFELAKDRNSPPELFHLPDGLRERCVALLNEPPKVWDDERFVMRPFINVKDLEGARRDGEIVRDLTDVMEFIVPHWRRWQDELSLDGTNLNDLMEFDLFKGLLTAMGNFLLNGSKEVRPIQDRDLFELFSKFEAIKALNEIISSMIPELKRNCSVSFLEFLDQKIQELLEDWILMGRPREIHGRLVHGILVRLSDRT